MLETMPSTKSGDSPTPSIHIGKPIRRLACNREGHQHIHHNHQGDCSDQSQPSAKQREKGR